jgi:predicted deacylase
MPDRRDLNRSFPGSARGSYTARLARLVFREIVGRCDFIVDLHTAAVRRTNFPNVRADCDNPDCARLARAFGCEVIVNGVGPDGSFRKEAVEAGCPTIVVEAGEVWKVEPAVLEMHRRGITNVLAELGMVESPRQPPPHQIVVEETTWVRAETTGLLRYHVAPGEAVSESQILATNTTLLATDRETIRSPHHGIVMGMTTMPAVNIGDPVLHIALPTTKRQQRTLERSIDNLEKDTFERDMRTQLATNIKVTAQEEV